MIEKKPLVNAELLRIKTYVEGGLIASLLRGLERKSEPRTRIAKIFAKRRNLKKCSQVKWYIFRNVDSVNFLLLHIPRELQELLCYRVSWVGGFVKLKNKTKQKKPLISWQASGEDYRIHLCSAEFEEQQSLSSYLFAWWWPREELRDFLFKKFLLRQHFYFPVESMGLSSIGIPEANLMS